MAIENLTDAAIRAAKPQAKLYHLHDGGGLYLAITPNGAKSWRMVYRFGGRQRRLVLGRYPALGLSDAREKWREARKTLANGLDPSNEKRRIDRERAEAPTTRSRNSPMSLSKSASERAPRLRCSSECAA
ncbi:MAG: DUF4102 domain-containing protein [Alphaproteobacteria bacterium]|nr:DUF4102 domain-containing protein [Alphaproteobacteria bacterium]